MIKQIGPFNLDVLNFPETVINPFSGESCELEPEAVAVYDLTKGAEMLEDYATVRACLDYFRQRWPKEYMILLD